MYFFSTSSNSSISAFRLSSRLQLGLIAIYIVFKILLTIPRRLLVRITLRQADDGLYYIALQEDFYHPDVSRFLLLDWHSHSEPILEFQCFFQDFLALLLPPLSPIIQFVLFAAGLISHLFASIAQVLGVWRLSDVKNDWSYLMNTNRKEPAIPLHLYSSVFISGLRSARLLIAVCFDVLSQISWS